MLQPMADIGKGVLYGGRLAGHIGALGIGRFRGQQPEKIAVGALEFVVDLRKPGCST